ncbi:MAG: DUF721 domain-containing protein [Pseudomonadota bacterium]
MTGRAPRQTSPSARASRGRGAFRQAGADLKATLTETAGKRGFAEPDILLRWTEIVGAALAPHCRPVKVSYGRSQTLGATLVVEVTGARAPEIELSAPRILERINSHYGYRAISRLKVTQTQAQPAGFAEAAAAFDHKPHGETPSAEATRAAAELTENIRDPALRAVLTRLGGHILGRPAVRRPSQDRHPQGDNE